MEALFLLLQWLLLTGAPVETWSSPAVFLCLVTNFVQIERLVRWWLPGVKYSRAFLNSSVQVTASGFLTILPVVKGAAPWPAHSTVVIRASSGRASPEPMFSRF